MNPTQYIPTHPDGRKGPSFFSATMAALWIIHQDDMNLWSWEGAR